MYLFAPAVLRIEPGEMPARVRARFGTDLRRAGLFAQLCLLGAQTCLDAVRGDGPLGVLWASELGAQHATHAALDDSLRRGEPAMPFTFIATQPHLAGALLAQRSYPVVRTAHLHLGADDWPWLLRLAQGWLAECERVLVGWVEESTVEGVPYRSGWCMLQNKHARGSARCEETQAGSTSIAASAEEWIARVAAWRAAGKAPLVLRGAAEAWRFTAVD